jgi:hypothetical protein
LIHEEGRKVVKSLDRRLGASKLFQARECERLGRQEIIAGDACKVYLLSVDTMLVVKDGAGLHLEVAVAHGRNT